MMCSFDKAPTELPTQFPTNHPSSNAPTRQPISSRPTDEVRLIYMYVRYLNHIVSIVSLFNSRVYPHHRIRLSSIRLHRHPR